MLKSWRSKTNRSYDSLFGKLQLMGSNPSSGPMKEVVNFLAYTYTKGLSSSSSPSLLTTVKAYEDCTAPTQEKKTGLFWL